MLYGNDSSSSAVMSWLLHLQNAMHTKTVQFYSIFQKRHIQNACACAYGRYNNRVNVKDRIWYSSIGLHDHKHLFGARAPNDLWYTTHTFNNNNNNFFFLNWPFRNSSNPFKTNLSLFSNSCFSVCICNCIGRVSCVFMCVCVIPYNCDYEL